MQDVFCSNVAQGFQATETEHQGHIIDDPGSAPGRLRASVPYASWSFSVRPVFGWGSVGQQQLSTAGWLAALPVLEPHWQVLMAHGVANGYVQWGPGKRIELKDASIYSEKNWGQGFPKKWAWAQCNTFAAHPELAVTAVCAIRTVLAQPVEETLGMLGIHYNGEFIELAPYKGPMSWEVAPWGSWRFCGKNERYEALLTARCQDSDGAVLRAPLGAQGLAPACKDTFAGACPCEELPAPWMHVWKRYACTMCTSNARAWQVAHANGALRCRRSAAATVAGQWGQQSRRADTGRNVDLGRSRGGRRALVGRLEGRIEDEPGRCSGVAHATRYRRWAAGAPRAVRGALETQAAGILTVRRSHALPGPGQRRRCVSNRASSGRRPCRAL